jgi:hypothetical protein
MQDLLVEVDFFFKIYFFRVLCLMVVDLTNNIIFIMAP